MRPFLFLGIAATAMITADVARAAEQRFASGENRVTLLELYTSEGCSSCPSAERWLGALHDAPGLWSDFVPLEFHVNYWDRLGWPDRFASREGTQREYDHAAAWKSGSVYTPCFVRDGAEWRVSGKTIEPSQEKAGVLALTVAAGKKISVEFSPAKTSGAVSEAFEVHMALLGSGFTSRVTAGENRGETLRHEFVVLAFTQSALPANSAGSYAAELAFPQTKITDAPRLAIAAWVTRRGKLPPLQATGGWLALEMK